MRARVATPSGHRVMWVGAVSAFSIGFLGVPLAGFVWVLAAILLALYAAPLVRARARRSISFLQVKADGPR
jgi:membrane protein implicated in regulation of membrane protease activity